MPQGGIVKRVKSVERQTVRGSQWYYGFWSVGGLRGREQGLLGKDIDK